MLQIQDVHHHYVLMVIHVMMAMTVLPHGTDHYIYHIISYHLIIPLIAGMFCDVNNRCDNSSPYHFCVSSSCETGIMDAGTDETDGKYHIIFSSLSQHTYTYSYRLLPK